MKEQIKRTQIETNIPQEVAGSLLAQAIAEIVKENNISAYSGEKPTEYQLNRLGILTQRRYLELRNEWQKRQIVNDLVRKELTA